MKEGFYLKGVYYKCEINITGSTNVHLYTCLVFEVPYCVLEQCGVIGVRFYISYVGLGKAAQHLAQSVQ